MTNASGWTPACRDILRIMTNVSGWTPACRDILRIHNTCIASPSRGLRFRSFIFRSHLSRSRAFFPGPVTDDRRGAGAERYRRELDDVLVVVSPMTDADRGQFNLHADAERCRQILAQAEFVQRPSLNAKGRVPDDLDRGLVQIEVVGTLHELFIILGRFQASPRRFSNRPR
jgi:hypothetical protein